MDSVQCAECQERYDSDEHPFCPRCGSMEHAEGTDGAVDLATNKDPRKRRVKAAGVFLVAVGAVTLFFFAVTAALAGDLVPEAVSTFADQPGGDLAVMVTSGEDPVANASVQVLSLDGLALASALTGDDGRAWFEGLDDAGVNVTLTHAGQSWYRKVLTLGQIHTGGDAPEVHFDIASDAAESSSWVGLDGFITMSRAILIVFAALAALTVAAGVAALRLRKRSLAQAGAVIGTLPWLVLMVASLNIFVAVVTGLFVAAFVVIRQGRAHFAD